MCLEIRLSRRRRQSWHEVRGRMVGGDASRYMVELVTQAYACLAPCATPPSPC